MTAARRHWPLLAALLCAFLVWQPIFVKPAERFNDDVMKSAVAVYAILRTINAAISVAKETEVGVQLVGSVTTQPGMVLDPIDETVGRVADTVFVLAAVSGVLSVAFGPVAQIGALLAGAGFAALWLPRVISSTRGLGKAGKSLAAFGLVLALALPLGYWVGGSLGHWWTEDARLQAQDLLNGNAETISDAVDAAESRARPTPAAPEPDQGTPGAGASLFGSWIETARDAGGAAGSAVRDAVPDMASVQERGGEILESSLTLIAIFVFRLIVLPMVLLWAGLLLARRMLA